LLHDILQISHAALHGQGEDSFALHLEEQSAFLCVTDGCGGLGSKRYAALENHTGAYIAARLAARTFAQWAGERKPAYETIEETKILCRELEMEVFHQLKCFSDAYCSSEKSRITGSMQRNLPTTFCALTMEGKELCFWWAGDSRGYLLDSDGLHQYTRDHLRGEADPFEALYCDTPLSNLLSADKVGHIQFRRVCAKRPCIAIAATDGIYSSLPTPMEVEMLLLNTLKQARSTDDWERRLKRQISLLAQDDATMLMLPLGFEHFEQMKEVLMPRREKLQKQFITPVRRHKGAVDYARQRWLQYKHGYDRTEDSHE